MSSISSTDLVSYIIFVYNPIRKPIVNNKPNSLISISKYYSHNMSREMAKAIFTNIQKLVNNFE